LAQNGGRGEGGERIPSLAYKWPLRVCAINIEGSTKRERNTNAIGKREKKEREQYHVDALLKQKKTTNLFRGEHQSPTRPLLLSRVRL
jgi:hypothetical protein